MVCIFMTALTSSESHSIVQNRMFDFTDRSIDMKLVASIILAEERELGFTPSL